MDSVDICPPSPYQPRQPIWQSKIIGSRAKAPPRADPRPEWRHGGRSAAPKEARVTTERPISASVSGINMNLLEAGHGSVELPPLDIDTTNKTISLDAGDADLFRTIRHIEEMGSQQPKRSLSDSIDPYESMLHVRVLSDPVRALQLSRPLPRLCKSTVNQSASFMDLTKKNAQTLPRPLRLATYWGMRSGELVLSVERCSHCTSHLSLVHNPEKYDSHATMVLTALQGIAQEDISTDCVRCFQLPILPKGYNSGSMASDCCVDVSSDEGVQQWLSCHVLPAPSKAPASASVSSKLLHDVELRKGDGVGGAAQELAVNETCADDTANMPSILTMVEGDTSFGLYNEHENRNGALEVQAAYNHPKYGLLVCTLHSKLGSLHWPNIELVKKRLARFLLACSVSNSLLSSGSRGSYSNNNDIGSDTSGANCVVVTELATNIADINGIAKTETRDKTHKEEEVKLKLKEDARVAAYAAIVPRPPTQMKAAEGEERGIGNGEEPSPFPTTRPLKYNKYL